MQCRTAGQTGVEYDGREDDEEEDGGIESDGLSAGGLHDNARQQPERDQQTRLRHVVRQRALRPTKARVEYCTQDLPFFLPAQEDCLVMIGLLYDNNHSFVY